VDSAVLVICLLLKGETQEIPVPQKIIWGVLLGLVTGLLMYVGGVTALQAASIVTGFPIGLVIIAIAFGILKDVRKSG
jgi:choline/glycine/proline betaine transport protein